MSNLITEIFDKQAVVDNLNQLGELINSSLNAIVSAAPKLQSPIDYMTALKSVDEIEKESIKTAEAKKKALSDLDKLYQQADKAIQQYDNLADAEYQTQTNLLNQYKEMTKEQKQLIEIERTRNQTMQNSQKLLSAEAKTEAELRLQTQQLIKASQSLRLTNADENKVREQLIAKINANKEALKGMTNEVSKQKDNIGNYKSALEGVASGEITVKEAIKALTVEMVQLEAKRSAGIQLSNEEKQRYAEVSAELGKLKDVQGDVAASTNALANDNLGLTATLQGAQGVAGGFAAVQGTMALFGGESEKVNATIKKMTAIMTILQGLQTLEKTLNKDSALMVGLRKIAHQQLNKELQKSSAAEVTGTATMGAFTAAEGVATTGAITLKGAVKAVGTAIKSVPVVGWILAAISGIITLISYITSANDEEERGNELEKERAENLKRIQEQHAQILQDIYKQGQALKAQLKDLSKLSKDSIEYRDAMEGLANATNLSKEYLESLTDSQRIAIQETYNLLEQQKTALEGAVEAQNEGLNQENYIAELQKQIAISEKKIIAYRQEELNWQISQTKEAEKQKEQQNAAKEAARAKEQAEREYQELVKQTTAELQNLNKELYPQSEEERITEKYDNLLDLAIKYYGEESEQVAKLTEIRISELKKIADAEEQVQRDSARKTIDSAYEIEKNKADLRLIGLKEGEKEYYDTKIELDKILEEKEIEELTRKYEDQLITREEYQSAYDLIVAQHAEIRTELEKSALEKQAEDLKKQQEERKKAYDDMVSNIGSAFDAINGYYEHQQEVTDEWYNNEKERIEASVVDEETREKRLAQLDAEKTKRDKATAKKQAEIKRKQAIFQNAVDAAEAMSNAVASVGLLLRKETEGDTYSAIARYIAAIAAGVSAVTTVSTLISRLLKIPAYEKGGVAEADKPFIAGEKGREIGFGQRTGKVYDFASPAIYRAPEPVAIKTASETNRIINNEYNKDVTLHNEVVVQVIDNKRVEKYFKIGRKS